MRAITVVPGSKGSARLDDLAEPLESAGPVLVEGLALGICGTDLEITDGRYGLAPPGRDRLILGHESLGRVLQAPESNGLERGDLVVGIVRRPDPVPCPNCAIDEWDMCRNGRYAERGIKELDGFGSQLWRIEPQFAVKVDSGLGDLGVLLEPASVVAKAWEHIERIGGRARWQPELVLVTGAGPIGLLAALLGVQRGLEVHVLDRVTEGPKPALVHDLGATYHHGSVDEACQAVDIAIECTGVGQIVFDVMDNLTPNGVVCLTGVSSGGRSIGVDAGALNRELVLSNSVIVGSVNANRRHYRQAATALASADRDWLGRLVTRRVPLDRFQEALHRGPHDVKVTVDLTA
ncbi:MAG TPA: glucose 1-dehydrogenase [Actinomycetes bacterium]|nr:glucose 1-dehydrogenase [Actinomycetes bacterium]